MGIDDYLLHEAEHKERVATELDKNDEPAVRREAARQRQEAAGLRAEWVSRQNPARPSSTAVATAEPSANAGPRMGLGPENEDPELAALREVIIEVIKTCYDPEIPVNIFDLGLIYEIELSQPGNVAITMTLTAPACPAAGILPGEVEQKVREVPGVVDVKLDLVWEPPWDQTRITRAAKLQLGIDW